jgi:beta-fructofuranosidase
MFSCGPDFMQERRDGAVWIAPGESLLGPWDVEGAVALEHPSLYAAQFIRDRGDWTILGFRDTEDGVFFGEIMDPLPIVRDGRGVRLA